MEQIVADWVEVPLTQEDINQTPEYAGKQVGDLIGKFVYRTVIIE